MQHDPTTRRLAAWGAIAVLLTATAITVIGIVTGLGTQRDDGVAAVSTIRAQVILGALDVTLLAVGIWAAVRVVTDPSRSPRRRGAWLVATFVVWLLWAICRYGVDAS